MFSGVVSVCDDADKTVTTTSAGSVPASVDVWQDPEGDATAVPLPRRPVLSEALIVVTLGAVQEHR